MTALAVVALALVILLSLAACIYWCKVGGWWGYMQANQCFQLICICAQFILTLVAGNQNE